MKKTLQSREWFVLCAAFLLAAAVCPVAVLLLYLGSRWEEKGGQAVLSNRLCAPLCLAAALKLCDFVQYDLEEGYLLYSSLLQILWGNFGLPHELALSIAMWPATVARWAAPVLFLACAAGAAVALVRGLWALKGGRQDRAK